MSSSEDRMLARGFFSRVAKVSCVIMSQSHTKCHILMCNSMMSQHSLYHGIHAFAATRLVASGVIHAPSRLVAGLPILGFFKGAAISSGTGTGRRGRQPNCVCAPPRWHSMPACCTRSMINSLPGVLCDQNRLVGSFQLDWPR